MDLMGGPGSRQVLGSPSLGGRTPYGLRDIQYGGDNLQVPIFEGKLNKMHYPQHSISLARGDGPGLHQPSLHVGPEQEHGLEEVRFEASPQIGDEDLHRREQPLDAVLRHRKCGEDFAAGLPGIYLFLCARKRPSIFGLGWRFEGQNLQRSELKVKFLGAKRQKVTELDK
jgi:hypothetical protein